MNWLKFLDVGVFMSDLQTKDSKSSSPLSGGWMEKIIVLVLIGAVVTLGLIFWSDLVEIFRNPEGLREWVKQFGVWSPLVFMFLQFIQVVIFIIPGDVVQIAGGYLFGIFEGFTYSVLGILAGSVFNFYLARLLGHAFIGGLLGQESLEKMKNFINSPKATLGFFLLFLIPGIPKDVLCYAAGLSTMRFRVFLLISFFGRFPALLGSVIIGDAAAGQQWILAGIIFGLAVLFFTVGFFFRNKIQALLENFVTKRTKKPEKE